MGGRMAGAAGAEGRDAGRPSCATQPCWGATRRGSPNARTGACCRQLQVQATPSQQSIGAGSGLAGKSVGAFSWQGAASFALAPISWDMDPAAGCAEWSIADAVDGSPALAISANASNQ